MTRHLRRACTAGLLALAGTALAQNPDPAATARLAVHATDLANGYMVTFCDERAPVKAAAVRAAWQDWRRRQQVDEVRRQVDPAWLERMNANVAKSRAALVDKMAAHGTPDVVCEGVVASFAQPDMDLRAHYPLAYGGGPAPSAPAGVVRPAPTGAGAVRPAVAAPTGTLYSVAQLDVYYATGSLQERRARLGPTVYVKGKAVRRRDSWFIEHDDPTFGSRTPISPGFSLAAYEGQTIVMSGRFKELPVSVGFLQDGRVVADPSRLTPSDLPEDAVLRRRAVPMDQVRAKPGDGVSAGDIDAVRFDGKGVVLLLDDGWLYNRPGALPPSDLDVKASRRLEPDCWHRWKSSGDKILVRWADKRGRLADDWKPMTGSWVVKPWPGGRVDPVEYVAQNFAGSLATGGVYSKSLWRFGADGRFTTSAYVQAGSGSMAAQNGFVAGQTSHQGPQGGQSSGFANGNGAVVTNQRNGADGSGNRGTWKLDGYTLELRYDNGRVARVFAFPWDDQAKHIWIDGTSYMKD